MPVTQEDIDVITASVAAIAPNLKALEESTKREFVALRSEVESAKTLAAQNDPIVVNKLDTMAAAVETMQASLQEGRAISARVDQLEALSKRPGGGWKGEDEAKAADEAFEWHKNKLVNEGTLRLNSKIEANVDAYTAYCEALPVYMRARENAMTNDIRAAMQTGVDPDGGYLVPVTQSSKIIKKVYETGSLRGLADVVTIGGKEITFPRDEGEFGYGWIGESTAPTETTTSSFGESKIAVHEMYAEPRVTQQMLEDAAFDVEGWVSNKVGERFGRIEGTAHFNGTGINQPRGLLTYSHGTTNGYIEQVNSGAATAVTLDGLYNLVFSLKDYYVPNAKFLMKRTTVRDILKIKDGDGRPIWQLGDIKAGQPSTILAHEVVRSEEMTTVGASALAIAFGDFKAAYQIVDRLGITILRDNLTSKPYVKFYHRRRTGGDVLNFEAVKLQKIAA